MKKSALILLTSLLTSSVTKAQRLDPVEKQDTAHQEKPVAVRRAGSSGLWWYYTLFRPLSVKPVTPVTKETLPVKTESTRGGFGKTGTKSGNKTGASS